MNGDVSNPSRVISVRTAAPHGLMPPQLRTFLKICSSRTHAAATEDFPDDFILCAAFSRQRIHSGITPKLTGAGFFASGAATG